VVDFYYEIIQPPFSLDYKIMTKKELRELYEWYINIIPERIKILTKAVNTTKNFEDWKADYTPKSLLKLGEWLSLIGEKEKMSEKKINVIKKNLADKYKSIDFDDTELTEKTISICMDIGMYMSQIFLKNNPILKWQLMLGDKRNVDYGHPVIVFGKGSEFNPMRIPCVIADALIDKTDKPSQIYETYKVWIEFIK
jgi:hypothetical protein